MKTPHIDAAKAKRQKHDSILLPRELLLEAVELIREEFRALVWRDFLPVMSNLPPWAKSWSVRKIRGNAPVPALLNEVSPTTIPQPSIESSEVIYQLYEFILGASWTKGELVYAARTGISLETERPAANMRSYEEFFEDLAATGDLYGLMPRGLLNQLTGGLDVLPTSTQTQATLVEELPKAGGAGNVGWFDLSSGAATATALEMALDMNKLCEFIERATLRRNRCTDIILPDVLNDVATRTVQGTDTTRNAIEIFKGMRPDVAVRTWFKAEGAGASGTHRITAADMTDQHGPRMVTPLEPTISAPFETKLGFEITQQMKTGGVIVKKPQVLTYMDPVNQA